MKALSASRSRSAWGALAALSCLLFAAAEVQALSVLQCLSANSDLYMIITTGSGTIGTQVTSVGLGSGVPCALSESVGDGVQTAFAATTGALLPNRRRTTVMSGFASNSLSCLTNFDPNAANGAGVLTLPGGLRTVSVDAASSTETLVDVTTADAAVPAAAAISTTRSINLGAVVCSGNSMVFPVGGSGSTTSSAASGEAQNQAVTLDDTTNSRVGNGPTGNEVPMGAGSQPTTPDGFLLRGSCGGADMSTCQIIVFTARPDGAINYGVSAAGYTVDSNLVHAATESAQQNGSFPPSTPTPTRPPIITEPAPAASPGALVVLALLVVLLQFTRLRRHAD